MRSDPPPRKKIKKVLDNSGCLCYNKDTKGEGEATRENGLTHESR